MLLTWHQTAGQPDLSNNVQREISETGLYQPTDSPLSGNFQLSWTQTFSPRAIQDSHLPPIRHPHSLATASHLQITYHTCIRTARSLDLGSVIIPVYYLECAESRPMKNPRNFEGLHEYKCV